MGIPEEVKTYKIKGVEVFSAGEWNKDKYSVEDLHSMVTAFQSLKTGFRPYLKLGHDDKQKIVKSSGLPSIGWVENLYVRGDKLYADMDNIPEKVFKLIKSKAYRKVSCEIYWDLDVNGIKHPRVVGAIALLGAENPGVMNLEDILSNYSLNQNFTGGVFEAIEKQDSFKQYAINFEAEGDEVNEEMEKLAAEMEEQKKSYAKAQEDLDAKAKEVEAKAAELAAAQEQIKKYELQTQEALKEANAAKLAKFMTELESKKLVTPGMKDLVQELMSDKKEYTVADKTLSKEEVITQVLTLAQEAGKINFEEKSRADFAAKGDKTKDVAEKIEKYAADNKCSYAQAYKAVMKDMKPGDKMDEEEK
jgi:hypothetical protein